MKNCPGFLPIRCPSPQLGHDVPPQMQVNVQVHESSCPVTPTICIPQAGKGLSPVSTPEHSTPAGTPRGTPVRGPRVGSSPKTQVRGIPIDVYRGILEEQSGLVQTYMNQTPINDIWRKKNGKKYLWQ